MPQLNAARLGELRNRIQRDIDQGILPSAQAAVGLEGEVVWSETFGDATDNNRYAIFSCTKALVAGVVWQLIDEGTIVTAAPVSEYFPAFAGEGKGDVTVEHLLTHTGGFPTAPMAPQHWQTREDRQAKMASWRLNWEPSSRFEYHPTSAHWVLGEIVHAVGGDDMVDAARKRVLDPLGLNRLALGVAPDEQGDILDLQMSGEFPSPDELEAAFGVREFDLGEVTPAALLGFNDPAVRAVGMPGGGGMSNANDLALLYQELMNNSRSLWSDQVLHRGTREILVTLPDPILTTPSNRTLGLIAAGDDGTAVMRGMGHNVSSAAFGHGGAGGQIAWADPATGISFSYLTNGIDQHFLRQAGRVASMSSRAALLTQSE